MVGLDSERWPVLRDAYGPASGVPELLTDSETIASSNHQLLEPLCATISTVRFPSCNEK
jgi:hypothetical protein